jgi:tetratricopeptide (TPR) repeat protein
LLAAGAVALLAAGAWYGWLWYTTPAPPEVALDGVEPAVARAIEAARAKVRQDGRSAAAWGELGEVLRAHGFDPASDECFAQAERLDLGEPRWPYLQGVGRAPHDPEGALPFLRRAVERCDRRDGGNDAPRLYLAEILLQVGQDDEAEQHLLRVQESRPDDPRLRYDLGLLAVRRKKDDEAVRHFTAAVNGPHTRQKACAQLAQLYTRMRKEADAADFARAAAQPPPDQPWYDPYVMEYMRRDVGRQGKLLAAGEYEAKMFGAPDNEARRLAEEALTIYRQMAEDPSDARARLAAGTLLSKLGRYDEAEPFFREAVALPTERADSTYSLGAVLCSQGQLLESEGAGDRAKEKYKDALKYLDGALAIKPDHGMAHLYRGLALKGLGRAGEARDALRQAVRCRPELFDTHLALGEALADDKHRDEAVVELRRAVELAPNDPRAAAALEKILKP